MSRSLGTKMGITLDRVRGIFKGLESGNGTAFFEHVADNVDWIVEGTHPLAVRYRSKADFRTQPSKSSKRSSRRVPNFVLSMRW